MTMLRRKIALRWTTAMVAVVTVAALIASPQSIFVVSFQPTANQLHLPQVTPVSTSTTQLTAWWSHNNNKKNNLKTENGADTMLESYKVLVKPRNRVSFDPDTGRYKVTETAVDASSDNNNRNGINGPWNSFKQTVYGAVDAGKTLSSSLPPRQRRGRRLPRPSVLEDGYSSLERTLLTDTTSNSNSNESPGKRFLRQYEQKSNTASSSSSFNDDSYFPAPILDKVADRPQKKVARSLSPFDQFKEGIYGTLDTATKLFSNNDETTTTESTVALESYAVPVQSTLGTSWQVREALPDLSSDNPVQKWKAVRQIRLWEEQELQQRLLKAREREHNVEKIKQAIYQAGDAAQSALDASVQLPAKVLEISKETTTLAQALVLWLVSIPKIIEQWIQTIANIPTQVEQTVTNIQVSVESNIQTTVRAVEEIQTIPTKVQQSVNDTTRAVEEVVTSAKVLVGLEKAKPKPPKVPPPQLVDTTPLGWKVAGAVASSTAQVAWWAGKGVAWITWKGAQVAWNKVSEQVGVAVVNQERPEDAMTAFTLNTASAKSLSSSSSTMNNNNNNNKMTKKQKKKQTPKKVSNEEDLQTEVQQALDLANEALRLANGVELTNGVTTDTTKNGYNNKNNINNNNEEQAVTADVVDGVLLRRKDDGGSSIKNITKDEL